MSITVLTVIIAVVVIGLAFAGIATRILLVKDGEFRGTCSSKNPYLSDGSGNCSMCGNDVSKCDRRKAQVTA